MQTTSPSPCMSDWFVQERQRSSDWTREENKQFESALALFDENTQDRWVRIAMKVPGKTVFDVFKQYKELEDDVSNIEAGLVEIPGYHQGSAFTLDLVDDDRNFDANRKRSGGARGSDQERKKGVPWTEDEHM